MSLIEASPDGYEVKNVLLLSPVSKNGRKYSEKAIQQATALYESAPVYLDHSDKPRTYADRIGTVKEPEYRAPNLYGTLKLNPKHPLTEAVLYDIENRTDKVGISHSIEGNVNNKTKTVTEITKVYSADIVSDPATTTNFFEQTKNEMVEVGIKLQEKEQKIIELEETLSELQEKLTILQEEVKKKKPIALLPEMLVAPAETDEYQEILKKLKS